MENIDEIKKTLKKQISTSYPGTKLKNLRKIFYDCIKDDKAAEFMFNALDNLLEGLYSDRNFMAKAMAAYIRLGMEDFHAHNLSDSQMKELNPIIRNSIYTFLKDYEDNKILKISGVLKCNLPSYWEDCVYDKEIG